MAFKDWWNKLKNTPLGDVIRHKHRFVVMDTDTYKEKLSFQLSGINLFVTVGITIIVLVVLTSVLIAFTPLREYIPGYTNSAMVEQTYTNAKRIDSIEQAVADQEWLIATVQAVLRGESVGNDWDSILSDSASTLGHAAGVYRHSVDDSLLRLEVEREDGRYEVKPTAATIATTAAAGTEGSATMGLFFTPVKGNIVGTYSPTERHWGVDIAAAAGSAVCAAYNGTVIYAGFTAEEGYAIALQHPAGIITIYRSTSSLLKHQGDAVRAGEPIAYVGTGSSMALGPHLHIEVWVNGKAANPIDYFSF